MAEACALFARQGDNVYSPIVHWHEVSREYDLPTDCHWWQKMNFDSFNRCDAMRVLTLPGWQDSVGVQQEMGWAEGKPHFLVEYYSPTNLDSFKHFERLLQE